MDQSMISSDEEYLYNKLDLIEIDFDSSTPEQDRDLVWKSLSNCYYSDMDESDISLFYNKKFFILFLEEQEGNPNSRIPHGFFTATVRLFNGNCYVTIWDLCKTYIDEKNTPSNICSFILRKYFEYLSNSNYIYKLPTLNNTNLYKIDEVHIYVNSNQSMNNDAERCYLNMNFQYIEPPQIEETIDANGMKTVYRKMKHVINPMMGVLNKNFNRMQQSSMMPQLSMMPQQTTQQTTQQVDNIISNMETSAPIQNKYSETPEMPVDYDNRSNPLEISSEDVIPPQNLGLDADSQNERDDILQNDENPNPLNVSQQELGSDPMNIPQEQLGENPDAMNMQQQQLGENTNAMNVPQEQLGENTNAMNVPQEQLGENTNAMNVPQEQLGENTNAMNVPQEQLGENTNAIGMQQQLGPDSNNMNMQQQQQQQQQQLDSDPNAIGMSQQQLGPDPNAINNMPQEQLGENTNAVNMQQQLGPDSNDMNMQQQQLGQNPIVSEPAVNTGIQLSGELGAQQQQQPPQQPMGGKTRKRRKASKSKTKKNKKQKKYKKRSKKPTKRRSFKNNRK